MPEPPKSGSAVMPSRPSAPISCQRCMGNSLERSVSAASGAMRSCAKRRTVSRSASMSASSPKFSVLVYMGVLPHLVCADKAHGHPEIGFGHAGDGKPFIRPEPDDDACHHLDQSHGGQFDIFGCEGACRRAVAQ